MFSTSRSAQLASFFEDCLAACRAQIEGDRPFAPAVDLPVQRVSGRAIAADTADEVALHRRLDLDDLGAEIRE
jgi:hypothetical protein